MRAGAAWPGPDATLPGALAGARRNTLPRVPQQAYLEFLALADAYRRNGGLTSGDALLHRVREGVPQPLSALARRIVARQVVSLSWQSIVLLPMFQFEPSTLTLKDGPCRVLQELDGVFDDWELARWFVQPNDGLDDRAPVECIDADLAAVLQAARLDRFIARG